MLRPRMLATSAVVIAAALAPAASAATPGTPGAPTQAQQAPSGHEVAHASQDGGSQAAMFGGGSLLLSWMGCSGRSGDDGHGGVPADAGDTGTKADESSSGEGDAPGECENPASGGSGG